MVLQSHLNLENCMTVRTGYVPQRSSRHDRESVSVPTGTKRRERSSGQERRSERAAKSKVKIKASENGETVFCSVRLSAWNRALSDSERRLPFRMMFRRFTQRRIKRQKRRVLPVTNVSSAAFPAKSRVSKISALCSAYLSSLLCASCASRSEEAGACACGCFRHCPWCQCST